MITGTYLKPGKIERLIRLIFLFSLFNLLLITVVGVFLRSIPVTGFGISWYKNILHAHSHFAFGGWVMPALLVLIMKYYPDLVNKIAYTHWRNIAFLLLLSAYGMLLSFPFRGYGPVSICFSTLSILASFYLAIVIWRVKNELAQNTSLRFLVAGLFYLVLSSVGPFATAPLIIMGKAGTPLYFNAIYFYLHFQYNGWFSFLLLGVLYKITGKNNTCRGNKVFILMNIACIPAYFLSTLWSHPSVIFYLVGGSAALIQLIALYYLLQDLTSLSKSRQNLNLLIQLAVLVFSVKLVLQLAGVFPTIADMAYEHKNFIIAYLHFVMLGFVSLFIFGSMTEKLNAAISGKKGILLFLIAWIFTEIILTLQAISEVFLFRFPGYEKWILAASCLFSVAISILWLEVRKNYTSENLL